MANQMPVTYQQSLMKVLQELATAKAAPDANLDELGEVEKQILASIRKPYDTASPGTPVGASMDMGAGASAPQGPAPGQLSPMLASLMGGGAPPAGSFPMGGGLMAGTPTPAPPAMDEVRRMLNPG